ncbi:MAG: ABC transporter ATP-binding protein [Candidatus Geothermarchaeales archaeon]
MARVLFEGVTKRFGDVVAVNELTLEARDGELIVLLGPSGCGKTTALRCLAGLEEPEEGDIYIGDRRVTDLPPKERDVAMVFQSYALYPHMKVFDNLAFPLKMRKVKKNEIPEKVRRVAELLRIEELLGRKPKQLSGGQMQRVALGRAVVREPQVFLMDEPLSNLDAKLRVYMRAELKKLQKELGITTIYVTHDQVEAMTMGDQVAVMRRGILQQVGTSHKIYSSPSNVFVAGFIGSPPTNFMDCTLVDKDGSTVLDVGEFIYPITLDMAAVIRESSASEELVLGVRPRDITVHRGETSKEAVCEGRVDVVEPLGDEQIVNITIGDHLVKAIADPDIEFEMGETVSIGFEPDKVHVFNKASGKAVL